MTVSVAGVEVRAIHPLPEPKVEKSLGKGVGEFRTSCPL
jgi:hypothetical protein